MKKLFYLVMAGMMVLAVSCKKDKPGNKIPEGAVDLGIVMTREDGTTYKLYWATSNLSEDGLCANPEDYGDYYAWGELEPYYVKGHSQDKSCSDWREGTLNGYSWDSYHWGYWYLDDDENEISKVTKYCTKADYWGGTGEMDGKTEFSDYDYADDAARSILHEKWRTPTVAEWKALKTQCTWTWDNNKKGITITAHNGNSIFLPSAGLRTGVNLASSGSSGFYWSASIRTDIPDSGYFVEIYSEGGRIASWARYTGHPIRPVYVE